MPIAYACISNDRSIGAAESQALKVMQGFWFGRDYLRKIFS
jgi:hypothetical protein